MAIVEGTNAGFVLTAPTVDPAGTAINIDYLVRATKFTAPYDAVSVTEIGWWCDNATTSVNFEAGIYSHDAVNGRPGSLLTGYSQTNAKGSGAGWKSATDLNISVTGSVIYWIGIQLDDTSPATNSDGATTGAPYQRDYKSNQTTLPDPWGTSDGTSANILAFYAVYTTAAGSTYTQSLSDKIYFLDSDIKSITKQMSDIMALSESKIKSVKKIMLDKVNLYDSKSSYTEIPVFDNLILYENKYTSVGKAVSDALTISESKSISFDKTITDSLGITDDVTYVLTEVNNYIESISDRILFSDVQTITEGIVELFVTLYTLKNKNISFDLKSEVDKILKNKNISFDLKQYNIPTTLKSLNKRLTIKEVT